MYHRALKKAGLKNTLPRLKILQLFEGQQFQHLTAEEIYKKLVEMGEDIGLATVYRVLTQFESAGLITRHHFEEGVSVFEWAEGPHHDHIICVKCGKIEEFLDTIIESRQKTIAQKYHFAIMDHCMYLYGFCELCRKEQNPPQSKKTLPIK